MGNVLSVGIQVLGRRFLVNEEGDVWGIKPNGNLKLIPNIASSKLGYNIIQCGKKLYRHRLMAYTYLGLDIENSKLQVDHIDGNRLNNKLSNLRVVNQQQNNWNRTKVKGYRQIGKKWVAKIYLNGKSICLGTYATEAEARISYITAKLIFHKII